MDFSTFFDAEFGLELSDEPTEDRDTLKRGRQSLGLSRNYVPKWDARDAFREFFQNWMDGMIDTQKVLREGIKIVIRENEYDWVATAHRPVSEELMGFIRFDKSKGVLEFTNFNAQLSRKALDIGVSSKRSSAGQAGTHGEGFKVASLVMVRKGYQVRYESARYYWSFQFGGRDKRHLYCHLTPMAETQMIKRLQEDSNRKMKGRERDLKGNICEDVTVKIGRVYNSKGDAIDFTTFKNWIGVSFALNRPSHVINTANGDLVMDKAFGGNLYLKGLFLSHKNGTRALKFGYNFYQGEVNRDRQQMTDSQKKAATLAKIWAEAITKGDEDVVKEYTKMLREEETKKWADVNISEEYMTNDTAVAAWKHMMEGTTSSTIFFYSKKTEAQDVGTISACLNKKAVSIPHSLWKPLYKFGLVRTPEEQRHHKLHNAPPSSLEETLYSKAIERSLEAIMALDERTQDFAIIFKSGANADLDLLLQESTLFINDKWLDFEKSHLKAPCWLSRHGVTRHDMPCDHLITRLYDLILCELTKGPTSQIDNSGQSKDTLRLKVSDSLRQMPRMIEVSQGQNPGELHATWTILERDLVFKMYGFDLRCQVILHRESTCSEKKSDVLFHNKLSVGKDEDDLKDWLPADKKYIAACGCPYQFVSQGGSGAVFKSLDPEEANFPMIARDYDQAFFGVPPTAIRPAAPRSAATPAPEPAPASHKVPVASSVQTPAAVPAVSRSARYKHTPSTMNGTMTGNKRNDDLSHLNGAANSDDGEKERSQSMADVETSQQSEKSTDEGSTPSQALKQDTSKRLSSELNSATTKLKTEQQRSRATSYKLQQKAQELAATLDTLESKELELRQFKADSEAQKQSLESVIEELEGEIKRLQETQTEADNRCAELSSLIRSLQTEIEKLQAEKFELEARVSHLGDTEISGLSERVEGTRRGSRAPSALQSSETGASREEFLVIQQRNFDLQKQIQQVKADHASITATLQGLSVTVQGVLNLPSREAIAATLQGVLGMIQGVLNLGTRPPVQNLEVKREQMKREDVKREDVKRERVKDEDDNHDLYSSHSKRRRQAKSIDLTEED